MNRQREEVAYRDNWHLKTRASGQATRGTNGPTLLLLNSSYFDNLEGVCDGDGALHGDRHRGEDAARVRDHRQPVQVGAQRRVHVTLKKTKKDINMLLPTSTNKTIHMQYEKKNIYSYFNY